MSDTNSSGTDRIEDPYTVGEKIVNVEGGMDRPEVFVEVRREDVGPGDDVTLMRNSDALDLYRQLGEYLQSQGFDVDRESTPCEECGDPIYFDNAPEYYKTPDDRFWHPLCVPDEVRDDV